MTNFDYRILVSENKINNTKSFTISKVYYDSDGVPIMYNSSLQPFNTLDELKKTVDDIAICMSKPILKSNFEFPQEYNLQLTDFTNK